MSWCLHDECVTSLHEFASPEALDDHMRSEHAEQSGDESSEPESLHTIPPLQAEPVDPPGAGAEEEGAIAGGKLRAVCPDLWCQEHQFELGAITAELKRRGYTVERVANKKLKQQREKAVEAVRSAQLVFGDIDYVQAALHACQIPVPPPDDYPAVCKPWLRRKVWRGTLKHIPNHQVFVKPAMRAKKFTGVVLEGSYDPFRLHNAGRNTDVWFSDVIEIVSEWRVLVCRHEIVGVFAVPDTENGCCSGVESTLDMEEVGRCVGAYCNFGAAPDGFVMDFGVLRAGEVVLVEVNEGYAFDIYSHEAIGAAVDVLLARWQQLKCI